MLCPNGWACVFKGSRKMQIHWGALVFIASILLNILQNYCTQSHKPYSHTSIYCTLNTFLPHLQLFLLPPLPIQLIFFDLLESREERLISLCSCHLYMNYLSYVFITSRTHRSECSYYTVLKCVYQLCTTVACAGHKKMKVFFRLSWLLCLLACFVAHTLRDFSPCGVGMFALCLWHIMSCRTTWLLKPVF